MFQNSNLKTKLISISTLLLIIGFLSGWLGFLFFGDMAKSVQIVFVSKEALIAMEERRVNKLIKDDGGNQGDNSRSIFFGKSDEAIALIENITKSFENRRTKVLFVSSSSGTAKNGVGISDIVHKELVKILSTNQ